MGSSPHNAGEIHVHAQCEADSGLTVEGVGGGTEEFLPWGAGSHTRDYWLQWWKEPDEMIFEPTGLVAH